MCFLKFKPPSDTTPRFRAESAGVISWSYNFAEKYSINSFRCNFVPNSKTFVLSGFNLSLLLLIQSPTSNRQSCNLRVISIKMMTHIMSRDYFTKRCCIECEKERPKDRSLVNTILCLERFTHTFFNFNHLLSIHQIWGKPPEGISRDAILILQQADDSTVVQCVKSRREV